MPAQNIDFSGLRFNLKEISESRILSQYSNSDLFKKILGVFTSEAQELLDAIVDMMEYRTINKAVKHQLDVIGRIVGQTRDSYEYTSDFWFTPDEEGLGADNGHWWVQNGPLSTSSEMDDETYRKWIWMRVLENHNLFSSKPEIEAEILDGIGEKIGIEVSNMMTGKIYAPETISLTNYNLLDYYRNTALTDNDYEFAYPATTSISSKVKV